MTTNNREGRCCPDCRLRGLPEAWAMPHNDCPCHQQSLEGKGWEREFDEAFGTFVCESTTMKALASADIKQFIRQRDAELVGAIKELKCRKQSKLDEFVDCAHNETLDQAISTIEGRADISSSKN